MNKGRISAFALLLFLIALPGFAQVDVMFSDDFENMPNGATPDMFQPTGSASPDWDNAVLNPFNGTIGWNSIYTAAVSGNATSKYAISPFNGGNTMLLGANFNPSSNRYVTVEYDVNVQADGKKGRAAEIMYADGYGNLDGTGGGTKIAIHLSFSDDPNVPDDAAGANNIVYSIAGEDNNVTTADGTERSTGITWTQLGWHHVRVVADQQNHTFDLTIIDKTTGLVWTRTGLPFNDPGAGYIRKVWFAQSSDYACFFDNLLVYQTSTPPPAGAPLVVMNEYAKGPVKANTGMDVDFFDGVDLQSIQYKIGSAGAWMNLTSDGSSDVILSGPSDKTVTAPVWIKNTDFAAMGEGTSRIYFRATSAGGTTESAGYFSFTKDTQVPNVIAVTTPDASVIPALTAIRGLVGDAAGGVAANSVTYTLKWVVMNQFWSGTNWLASPTNLPTLHTATSGGATVAWTDTGNLPTGGKIPPAGTLLTIVAQVTDIAGNGVAASSPVSFTLNPGFPGIKQNVSAVGPARTNAFAGIDVDFSDDIDLQTIQYRIGIAGAWTNLTSDGVNAFTLGGATDTSVTALVYILNTDFAALPEGQTDLYFRATDNVPNTSTTTLPVAFSKDTLAPTVPTITAPSTNPFSSLPTVAGLIGDAAGGAGFAANSTTFTIQRSGDGLYWTGTGWGALTPLAASNPATADASVVSWEKNATLPTMTQLTTGATYTFVVKATDRAGNTSSASFSSLFADIPEVASVTTPTNGLLTVTPFSALGVTGQAADHESGSGLNANSTTFTLRRVADGWYWNGAGWQAAPINLPTTHAATSASAYATWTPASAMPGAGALLDGDYVFQAKATNRNGGTLAGPAVTVTYSGNLPLIVSGTMSASNTYLTLSFSEKVWGNGTRSAAIAPSSFTVTFQQNGGGITGSTIAGLYADAGLTAVLSSAAGYTTVYAKLSNSGGSALGVERITVTANAGAIFDNAGQAMSSAQTTGQIAFNLQDLVPPLVVSRETLDLNGNGYIDAMRITFSEPVSDASVVPAGFTIAAASGTTFAPTANGDTANDTQVYFTFNDNLLLSDALPQLTVAAGAVKDLAGNAILFNGPVSPTDKAGPALLSASASDAALIKVGIDPDDTVTLTFSENTTKPAVNAGNIDAALALSGGHSWLDGAAAIGSATWNAAGNILTVTLSTTTFPPTVTAGDTITPGSGLFKDTALNASSGLTSPGITGTFSADLVPPGVLSVVTRDVNGSGYIDRLVVTFSEPVDEATISAGAFSVSSGTIAGVVDDGIPGNAVIWVNLVDNALPTDAVPSLTIAPGGIKDLPGNPNALVSAFGSTDGAPALIMSATSDVGLTTLTVRFSEPVDTSDIGPGNLVAGDFSYANNSGGGATGVASMGADADGTDRVVTITVNSAFAAGDFGSDTIAAAAAQIFDMNNNASPTTAVPLTLVDTTPPSITSRQTLDLNGNGYIDALRITFSEPVSDASVVPARFAIAGASGLVFSPTANGDVANNAQIYITFNDNVLATDAVPMLTVSADAVRDIVGNAILANGPLAPVDRAGPAVLSSVATDGTVIKVGIDADDAVTVSFSENTNQPPIAAGNIDTVLALSGGHSWKSGGGAIGSAAWVDARTLKVTLSVTGGAPTIAAGDTITLGGVTDVPANAASTAASPGITGSFSADTLPPVVSSAVTRDTNGDGRIDRLVVTFSEPVDETAIVPGNFAVPAGTITGVVDDGAAGDPVIWVNLADTLPSDALPALTIAPGGIRDLPGNPNLLIGGFGSSDGAGPAVLGASASDGAVIRVGIDADDTVTIDFSEATNKFPLTALNIDAALALSGGHSWKDVGGGIGSASWSADGRTLTVTLSVTGGPPTVAAGDTINVGGGIIKDTALNPGSGAASPDIAGTFSADTVPPNVLSVVTQDTNGNGYLDRLVVTFDKSVDPSTIVQGAFSVSLGSIVGGGVVDNGVPADDVIWVDLTDGGLSTDALPALSLAAGGIQDYPGNGNTAAVGVTPADKAPPAILTRETADLNGSGFIDAMRLVFSEPITDASVTSANFSVSGGVTVTGFTTGGTANDAEIFLSFTDGVLKTDATPTVTYTAGTLKDLPGNLMASAAAAASTDKAPPVILTRETADLNGSGYIDAMRLVLSEPIQDATVTAANFGVSGGVTATGFTTGATPNDAEIFLSFTDGVLKTDAAPTVSYTAGTLKDTPGNFMASAAASASTDKAPPAILTRETADLNGSGYIDAMRVVLSEPVSDATVTAANFSVSGGVTVTGFTTGATPNDAEIFLSFTDGVLKTDATPTVSYTAGTLKDTPGNLMASAAASASTDKAGPALISAAASDATVILVGIDADDTVTLTFSENTSKPTISAGNINAALTLGSGHSWLDGAGAIGSAVWNAAGNILTVTLSTATSVPTVAVADTITLGGGVIFDTAANASSAAAFSAISGTFSADTTPPVILTRETADLNGSGFIDAMRLVFSEPITDASVTSANFSVSGGVTVTGFTTGGTANDAEIFLSFTDGVLKTDATPTVTYTAGTLKDLPGNLMASAAAAASTDKAPPVILTRETADLNGSGYIDAMRLVLSEPIQDATVTAANFGVSGGVTATGFTTGATPNDAEIFLSFTDGVLKTDAAPTVSYTAGTLKDTPGNFMASAAASASTDKAPPAILTRETADLNGSGYIDAMRVVLSEPVSDATVTAANFSVSGGVTVTGFTTGATPNDAEIFLSFTDGVLKTDATPTVSYTAGTLKDTPGNLMASAAASASTDKAGPALISAAASDATVILVGIDADDTVTLTFSENTSKPTISAGNINAALTLGSGHSWLDGAGAIGSAVWNAAGNILTVTLSTATSVPTVAVADTITLGGGVIFDTAANASSAAAFSAISGTFSADTTPPVILTRETADLNGSGFIDAMRLVFSEPITDASVTSANFSVSGGVTVTGFTTGGTANDAEIFLSFTDGVLKTDATPTVTYTAGTLKDLPGNLMASAAAAASTDKAPPVILTRETADLNGSGYIDAMRLVLSEPIQDATVTAANFGVSGGVTATGFTTGATPNDAEIFLSFTDGVLKTDATPTVSYTAGTLKDTPGNFMASAAASASTDKAPPAILTRETADLNGSGYIDAMRVVLSEPVSDATVTAANFSVSGGVTVTGFTTGATPNDAEIFLSFTDGVLKTDATPTVSYTAGTLKDTPGNLMASAAATASTDKAPPVILSADASVGFNEVLITFSEPVSSASGSAQPLAATDFSYGNGGAGGATSIVAMGPDADGSDGVVRVQLDQPFAPGDTSLDTVAAAASQVFDAAGNAGSTASVAIFAADIIPPSLTAGGAVTRDTNGDGFIDRIELTFSEPVNAALLVAAGLHVSAGTIGSVVDNGAPTDPVIWVNLADGTQGTGVVPTLTLDAGAISDLAGNTCNAQSITSVDGAPPVILVSLAVTGERTVALKFSEPVSGPGTALAIADFIYSDAGNPIGYVSPIDLSGNRSREVFISLSNPLSAADVLLPRTVAAVAGRVQDAAGNLLAATTHRVTDVYLGLVEPVWASDGGIGPALKSFDGGGGLADRDITLQANDGSGSATNLIYDVNVPASDKTAGMWLPQWIGGVVGTAHAGATSRGAATVSGTLDTYLVPGTDVKSGDRFEFLFEVGGRYAARVVNRKDPRTLAPWVFAVQDMVRQRGGVTILNNVISPRFMDVTTVVYNVNERGSVTILVSDIAGNIVNVLQRGTKDPGNWSATWDGRNRGGRAVAPGLYFVKVVGPGIDEVRKVLVTD